MAKKETERFDYFIVLVHQRALVLPRLVKKPEFCICNIRVWHVVSLLQGFREEKGDKGPFPPPHPPGPRQHERPMFTERYNPFSPYMMTTTKVARIQGTSCNDMPGLFFWL